MAVKDLFSTRDKYLSRKQMRENYRSDPTFQKKILSDSKVANILDTSGKQKKVHDLLIKKAQDQKVSAEDMNEIARELSQGRVEGISSTKGQQLAKAFFPGGLKKEDSAKPKETRHFQPQNDLGEKTGKNSHIYLTRRAKIGLGPSAGEKTKGRPASFFDAMQSVARNRK